MLTVMTSTKLGVIITIYKHVFFLCNNTPMNSVNVIDTILTMNSVNVIDTILTMNSVNFFPR
jgi:hypothetical protein